MLTAENYVERMSAAIRALAEQGNTVFVGRIPIDPPRRARRAACPHIRLAGDPCEAHPGAARLGDEQAALQIVRQADERRRTWFRRFFTGANWKDPRYYDLMINTGRIPAQTAVELIVAAALSEPE